MTFVALLTWLLPLAIGIGFGLWQAKRPAVTPGDFGKDLSVAILFAGCTIFMVQMVLVGALKMAVEGNMAGLGRASWQATFWAAALWVPGLVIAYVLRAMKIKRSG